MLVDQVSWFNKGEHHQGVGQLQIEELAKNSASFVLDLYGNGEALNGTFYAKGEEVDISPWVEQWVTSEYELADSRGSFVMWASIQDKSIQSIQLDLSNSRFNWQTPEGNAPIKSLQASILGGQIHANPVKEDWVFNLDNLTIQINDQVLVSSWVGKKDAAGNISIQHQQPLKLATVLPMLALGTKREDMLWLDSLEPAATLNDIYLTRTPIGEVAVKAALTDIQWQQTNSIPGMSGLDAELNWFGDNGRVTIKSKAGTLAIDNLLPKNLDYQHLYADLYIQQTENGVSVYSDNVLFKSEWVTLQSDVYFDSQDNHFALASAIEPLDVKSLEQFYPAKLMGKKTQAYLIEALQGGKISQAEILWHGVLNEFPYAQNQGVFQAQLNVEQGQLKFAPQWPVLSALNANVLFENEGLAITSQQGRLMDVTLLDLEASIPSFSKNAALNIAAKAEALGPQVTDLMLHSNLANTLGKTLQQVQVDGSLTTELNLHIPLKNQEFIAKGTVFLSGNQVTLPRLGLSLEQSSGQISFVNEQIDIQQIDALLLEQPISLALTGDKQPTGYQTNIKIHGDWQVTPLLQSFQPNLAAYLTGSSEWQANVSVILPSEGYQYSVELVSNLTQLASKLPTPFDKQTAQALPLVVTSQGNQQASSIKLTLGDDVEFNGNLPHQDMQFSRAHLAIGENDLMGMGLGFSISANVSELDAAPWYDTLQALIKGIPNTNKPLLEAPKRIFINADKAIIASQPLSGVEIIAKNTSDSWLLDINAQQARMEVALYKDWLQKGVHINADFIELATWQSIEASDAQKQPTKLLTADIDTLPPVNFSCRRCSFMQTDLGKIDFKLTRATTGMKIDSIRMNNAHGLFYGSGEWFLTNGASSTRLKGEFSSSDFGAFLKGFNFNSGIKDSRASSTFDLSWQRAPYEFNFDSLNGQIDWHLTDGYLTEVTDKGSRLFSLLSLESLVRKLKLDFRDVFAKGFFYDKIKGSFQLTDGIADTRDTIVDGGAGEIVMHGYTDLVAKELNYQISFAPNVTSSLPVIVAWMVNPATGIAALALDQMISSAKVISNINFSLTGTLNDPILTELGRDSREIELPARKPVETESQPLNDKLDTPVNLQIPIEEPISE